MRVRVEVPPESEERLARWWKSLVEEVAKRLEHYATGDMVASSEARIRFDAVGKRISIGIRLQIRDPAARVLHMGSKPHCPPRRELHRWAKAKYGLPDREAWALGMYVRQRICERGNVAYGWLDELNRETRRSVRISVGGNE